MPMAKLFVDPTLVGAASPYYTMFPVEPTPSASAASWIQTDAKHVRLKNQTLSELLKLIADNATAGGNALIVCHGNDRGLHFYVGDTSHDVFLETDALSAIRKNLEGKETDANTEQILMLKPGFLKGLKALILKVQALALDRIDVRSCNTGHNKDGSMSALQVFFNCNTFCAPKLFDSFGPVNYGRINNDPGFWQKWLKEHRNVTIKGTPPDRFALSKIFTGRNIQADALAESKKAITDWAAYYLPPSPVFTADKQLYYHGLTDLKGRFVFAGEADFRAQLVEAYRGKEPSRTVDVKKTGLPRPDQLP
jgi:hypothetical protein